MEVPLLVAVRCVLFGAAANGVLHCGYTRLRHWHAPLPFSHHSAAADIRAFAIGAVAGQVVVAPFLFWLTELPLMEGAWCSAQAALFFLPLYLPLCAIAAAVWMARRLPQLLASIALVTVALFYLAPLLDHNPWSSLEAPAKAAAVGHVGLLMFELATRFNVATLFVIRNWEAQGRPTAGGQYLAWLHMVAGTLAAALLLCTALGWRGGDWWLLCTLTLISIPSLPNPLSERFDQPLDPGVAMKQYLILLAAVFLFMVVLPMGPIAWGLANQLWWMTAADWLSIELLEEVQDTPAAWPLLLQWSLARDRPAQGGRPLGAGPRAPDYGTATTIHPPPVSAPTAAAQPRAGFPRTTQVPPPTHPSAPPEELHTPSPPQLPPRPNVEPDSAGRPQAALSDRELRARAAEERIRLLQQQQQQQQQLQQQDSAV